VIAPSWPAGRAPLRRIEAYGVRGDHPPYLAL